MIVLKIAFRNLVEHKTKTAIIGFLVAFAIAFLVVGNSVMDGVNRGMRTSYSANFTGDLIVHGIGEQDFSLLPAPGAGETPVIPAFDELEAAAAATPGVAATLPVVGGMGSVSIAEEMGGLTFLWGVDFNAYRTMFPDSLSFVEGGFPSEEGAFVLLSKKVQEETEKETGRPVHVGDKIILGSMGTSGSRLREATVAGVFAFVRGGDQLDQISLVDAATLRSLKGMTAFSPPAEASGDEGGKIAVVSEDELFAEPSLTGNADTGSSGTSLDLENILGDVSVREKYAAADSSAWNFLLLRAADPSEIPAIRTSVETAIAESGAEARVDDWRWGAGMVADLAYSIQIVFNVIVLVVSVVAVIIIMNTLVISVTERVPEIGTIRAIGGPAGFVRSMIVWETLSISVVFGLAGIIVGSAALGIANLTGIESDNMFFALLFGSNLLRPTVSAGAVAWSLAATALIGTLSSLYPTAVALKISPVKAMQKA
jgi:putative ABC transport system permease protein